MHTSWSNSHNVLRKQKSCVDIQPVTIRSRRPALHKQYSVDYQHVKSKVNSMNRGLVISGQQQTQQGGSANSLVGSSQLPGASNVTADGACANVAVGMKKRHTGVQESPVDSRERHLKKPNANGREEKIVLQISLAPVNISQEFDGAASEVDSPRGASQLSTSSGAVLPKNYSNKENIVKSESGVVASASAQNAAQRRAQFHASRASESSDRKPGPIVRAMSAPIRSFDESAKIIQSKRKLRRRKIGRERDDFIYEDNEEESYLDLRAPDKAANPRKSISFPRSRSSLGCDIETLVSLFSSGESDSEREDSVSVDMATSRAPMLRKGGKSVSFQDENAGLVAFPRREFPAMLRRGSIAPLAARIRANRPPTAPPGSIYKKDFDKTNDETVVTVVEPVTPSTDSTPKAPPVKSKSFSDNKADDLYPDNVRTIKERECWKMFQKMSGKGVAITYETILRGMLTPTELRSIQKQRELEEKAIEEENAAIAEVLISEAISKF